MTEKRTKDTLGLSTIKKVYLARQPIFNRRKKVVAYELLFRTGFHNVYDSLNNGDYASSKTMLNGFITFGLDLLSGGKPVYINFTRNLILELAAMIFPSDLLTIEILEDVAPDEYIIEACHKLKKKGYLLALDDFSFTESMRPLIDVADIIKIDYRASNVAERRQIIARFGSDRLKFLAEKVETGQEFDEAMGMGFSYFQGYFFSKPQIVEGQEINGYKHKYLDLLREIHNPDVGFDIIEHIVKRDMALTYKLLRFINSAAFGFHMKIQSIRQALTLLGLIEFKNWVSLVALSEIGHDKPEELMVVSMLRAKFCEFLAFKFKMRDYSTDLFLVGMFSNLDAFIDRPMERIVSGLPLSDDIKNALCGRQNTLREILDIVIAYEKGDWAEWSRMLSRYSVPESEFPEIYVNSVDWVNKIFR